MNTRRGWVIGAVVAVVGVAALIAVLASGGGGDGGSADSGDGTSAATHETGTVTVEGTPLPTFQGVVVADKAVGLDGADARRHGIRRISRSRSPRAASRRW